jgi:hypothetical protein
VTETEPSAGEFLSLLPALFPVWDGVPIRDPAFTGRDFLAQIRVLALTVVFVLNRPDGALAAIHDAMLRLGQLLRLVMSAQIRAVARALPGRTVSKTPHVTRGPNAAGLMAPL